MAASTLTKAARDELAALFREFRFAIVVGGGLGAPAQVEALDAAIEAFATGSGPIQRDARGAVIKEGKDA